MRVLLDGTPLLGNRAGIGRYTEQLLPEMASRPEIDVRATAFSHGASKVLRSQLPAGVASRVSPIPARVLDPAWRFLRQPPVEWLARKADIFHATNFLLPPLRRIAAVVTVHDLAFLTHPATVNPQARDLSALVPLTLARADAGVPTPTSSGGGSSRISASRRTGSSSPRSRSTTPGRRPTLPTRRSGPGSGCQSPT